MATVQRRPSAPAPRGAPCPPGLPFCWGATAAEVADDYPCAGLAPAPYRSIWRAVDVAAPAAVTWRWLRQVKVAPYSYDWIDNLGRRSPRTLTAGLADIAVGDELMVFRVVAAEPGREFTGVMTPRAERLFGQISGTYRVTPVDDERSRLVVRLDISVRGLADRLRALPLAWGDLVMMRKQLLTLKHLAETSPTMARHDGESR
ncbi:MAG TPA: hypothetical protein VF015_09475 [Acidimicrobiales bacterium]